MILISSHLSENETVANRAAMTVRNLIVLEGFNPSVRRWQGMNSLKKHLFIKHLSNIYSKVDSEDGSGEAKINNKPVFLQKLKTVEGGSQGNK